MIMTDESHAFTCTDCRHTGGPCMEAIWLCKQLIRSIKRTTPPPERELTSSTRFGGCGIACESTVQVSGADVRVFCGVEDPAMPLRAGLPRALVLAAPASGPVLDQPRQLEQRQA